MLDEMIESLIRRAAESDYGIRISTTNVAALKRKCYIAKRSLLEEGYNEAHDLTLTEDPEGGMELWLIRRSKLNKDPRPAHLRDYLEPEDEG